MKGGLEGRGENSSQVRAPVKGHGVLRLRSAAPHFAQDDRFFLIEDDKFFLIEVVDTHGVAEKCVK